MNEDIRVRAAALALSIADRMGEAGVVALDRINTSGLLILLSADREQEVVVFSYPAIDLPLLATCLSECAEMVRDSKQSKVH